MHRVTTNRWVLFCLIGTAGFIAAACAGEVQLSKQQHLENGNARFEKGEFREAVIEYRRAIQADPSFGEAHSRVADAYTALNDAENALTAYLQAADLAPTDDELQLKAGNMLLYARRFDQALGRARAVLRRNPSSAPGLLLLGSALAGLQQLDAADAAQQQALAIDPRQAGTHLNVSALQAIRGNESEALAALHQAEKIDPTSVAVQLSLGSFYWAVGQVPDAERALKRAIELEPENVLGVGALASVYMNTNRPAEAEPLLQKVMAIKNDVNSRVALSTFYLSRGRHADAIKVLEPLLADRATFPIAKTRIALVQSDAGQQDAATESIAEVLRREPQFVPALAIRSQMLVAKGASSEGLAVAKAAIEVNPLSGPSQYALGRAYAAGKDGQSARDAFLETIKVAPRTANAYLELSRLHAARGEMDLAVRRAEQAVGINPRSLEARLLLARALMGRPQTLPRAEEEVRQLAASHPDSVTVHLMSATVASLKKDRAATRLAYERAASLDPHSVEALQGLVGIDIEMKQLGAGQNRLESFVASHPTSAEALMLLAQVYAMQRDTPKAERTLRKVIDLKPANLDAYSALGSIYLSQNKLKEARAEFINVTVNQPKSVGAFTLVGTLSEFLGEPDEAEKWYKQALQIDPKAAAAANNLAWMYAEKDENLDVAVELARAASVEIPDRAEVSDTLGWAYYKADLITSAIPAFQKSIERNPQKPLYHYHLGMAYMKQRDVARARASLQRALSLNASFAGASEARNALASLD